MKIILVILLLLVAVIVTGALVAGPQLRDAFSGFSPKPTGTEVRVEAAALGKLVETVSAPGGIEPHTDVQIAAEVSARIIQLPFREGEEVRQGDIVCKLADKDLMALLVSAKARRDGEQFRLRSDQARLEGLISNVSFARKELGRIQTLFQTGDTSRRELDNAMERVQDIETSVEATTYSISVAESSLAAAEAEIERAEDGLNNTVIVAPMDGVITLLTVEIGEVVTGSTTNPGTVMMTIAELSRMVMNAEVAESDIASIVVGQNARIHINAYQDETFSGTVRQIALQRSISPNGTGYFRTEIEIDLQGRRIYSGLMANVDIEIATHEGVVVPYQAIVIRDIESLPEELKNDPLVDPTKSKASVVFRVLDSKAKCTLVKPGSSDLTHRVVLEGLSEDDVIVTGPYKVLETIAHDELVQTADNKAQTDEEASETEEEPPPDVQDDADDEAKLQDDDAAGEPEQEAIGAGNQ